MTQKPTIEHDPDWPGRLAKFLFRRIFAPILLTLNPTGTYGVNIIVGDQEKFFDKLFDGKHGCVIGIKARGPVILNNRRNTEGTL